MSDYKGRNLDDTLALDAEDLDLSELGLYTKKDSDVDEDDYFLTDYTMFGLQLWARKSEQGKKWQILMDSDLAPKKKRKKK